MMKIVVIQPDPVTCKSVMMMLGNAGFESYAADSAEQALSMLDRQIFGIVITESDLPGMTGSEMISTMRQKLDNTPVLVLSTDDSTETKLDCFGHGADDFLAKPFHREELIARIVAITMRCRKT